MLAIFILSFYVIAWSQPVDGTHYCYFCATSLSGIEPAVQAQVMNQRLFYYPRDAIQTHCWEPWLSRRGSLQICSEPMCVSVHAQIENVNITVLGCADTILRPSVKLPDKNEEHCVSVTVKPGVDFSLCYCSSSLCNTGGSHSSSTSSSTASTRPIAASNVKSKQKTKVSGSKSAQIGDAKRKRITQMPKRILPVTPATIAKLPLPPPVVTNTAKLLIPTLMTTTAKTLPSTTVAIKRTSAKKFYSDRATKLSEAARKDTTPIFVEADLQVDEHSGEVVSDSTPTTTTTVTTTTTTVVTTPSRLLQPTTEKIILPTSADSQTSKSTISPFTLSTTAVSHARSYSTHKLDYDPDEQEVIELNSEEMEKMASARSDEYGNYNDLSSPEEEFLFRTDSASSSKEEISAESSTPSIALSAMENRNSTQSYHVGNASLYSGATIDYSNGIPIRVTISSTERNRHHLHLTTPSSTAANVKFGSTIVDEVADIPHPPEFFKSDNKKGHLVTAQSDIDDFSTNVQSEIHSTVSTPMVLEQGLSHNRYGTHINTTDNVLTLLTSEVTEDYASSTLSSHVTKASWKHKKFGLHVNEVRETTTLSNQLDKSNKDTVVQNRHIADSPSSQQSQIQAQKETLKADNDHKFVQRAENAPVLGAHKSRNSAGFCIFLLLLCVIFY